MKTTVDWLRFRAKNEPVQILDALRPMYGDRAGDLHLLPGQKGILGFRQSSTIKLQRYADRSHGLWRRIANGLGAR